MIISSLKPQTELHDHLQGIRSVFVVGCGACAAACKSGGEDEVFKMEEWLCAEGYRVTGTVVIDEACHIMRAARDLRQNKIQVAEADAVLVMTCGAGVQSVSDSTEKRVIGALDSLFLGNIRRFGQYEEKCSLCGDCILNETAGICPVTNCSKSLLNGPCGGMENGKCEADRDIDCAWSLIFERLKRQGRQGIFAQCVQPKEWGKNRKPGRHKIK